MSPAIAATAEPRTAARFDALDTVIEELKRKEKHRDRKKRK